MSEISHLATDKDIVDMWSVIIKIIYTLIAGAIGGACTFWWSRKKYLLTKQKLEHEIESSRAKIEADKKSIRQQMITNNIAPMRQAWINELRVSVSEYLSDIIFIVTYKNTKNPEFKKEFRSQYTNAVLSYQFKYSKLDLMLPFKREENDEKEAEAVREKLIEINKFVKNDKNNIPSIECVKLKVKECRNSLKILLKKEWDETKSLKEIDGINNIRKK